jgi:hypothetical protein
MAELLQRTLLEDATCHESNAWHEQSPPVSRHLRATGQHLITQGRCTALLAAADQRVEV